MRFPRSTECRQAWALAALLVALLPAATAHGENRAPKPAIDSQRLVYLLEYIGTDYPAAVRDGRVVNQFEFGEVLRFTKQLIRDYRAMPKQSKTVSTGLAELLRLIEQRAASDQVWSLSRKLLPELVSSLGSDIRPQTAPNIANGRRLWGYDCAICHGPTGGGDGEAAGDMDPPPTAFRGDTIEQLSPRQVFNALTFGVQGTAMPSFIPAYSDAQRWDVAFFVMTLRVEFEPQRPPSEVMLPLEDLIAHSNVELLRRLRAQRPDASQNELDWLRINLASASGAKTAAGADAGSGALAVALQLQDAFGRAAERAMPRVVGVTSYVRDAAWSPEQLQAEHGDAWMVANADALRYPGFRPLRSGSGVLVEEGYVISCNHIIRDDRNEVVQLVDVELPNQIHLASGVVGSEPTLDLAILRFAELPADIELGELDTADSDLLQTGQWVIALGDPPGAESVFAVGLVSSPAGRQCYQERRSATLLQSSLVVPPGGFGGAVIDIFGRVAGINVGPLGGGAIPTGNQPLAANTLPINLVLNLFEALKIAQSQRSPWLGISVLELPLARRQLAAAGDEKEFPPNGVYIDDVFDPSPAARAGVRPGDFLTGLGGYPVLSVGDFQTWLYVLGIDAQAELELMRDGEPLRVTAPIEVRPESATMR
jgi:S1-C subfamily serine protease/mono/diheme cytochrome c family protein